MCINSYRMFVIIKECRIYILHHFCSSCWRLDVLCRSGLVKPLHWRHECHSITKGQVARTSYDDQVSKEISMVGGVGVVRRRLCATEDFLSHKERRISDASLAWGLTKLSLKPTSHNTRERMFIAPLFCTGCVCLRHSPSVRERCRRPLCERTFPGSSLISFGSI